MGVVLRQNLGQIRSIVVKKVKKKTGIINSFCFHVLHREYLLKQKEVVVQALSGNFRQI